MRMPGRSVSRRALIGAVLMVASGASTALALSQAGNEVKPGTFLIAPRQAADPNFAGTVVLVVRIDDSGALGLAINRPTDIPVSSILQSYKPARHVKDAAFSGGPVQAEALLALYRSAKKMEDASPVFGDVYLISTRAALERVLRSKPGARHFRVYMSYTGWAHGQLEHEMDLDVWRVLPADADTVFAADPAGVWRRLIERTELRFALLIPR